MANPVFPAESRTEQLCVPASLYVSTSSLMLLLVACEAKQLEQVEDQVYSSLLTLFATTQVRVTELPGR